tara:strand:+ start:488 stop:772 length:285 start_codon:yes stop_codon:yes gene_type:complete
MSRYINNKILETYKDHKIGDLVRTESSRKQFHWIVSDIHTVVDKYVFIRGKQISLNNLKKGNPPMPNARETILFSYAIKTEEQFPISDAVTIKS